MNDMDLVVNQTEVNMTIPGENRTFIELQQQSYSKIISTAELISDYLSLYYTPILVLSGSIGNILSVFVFFKTKLKKLSSSFYLAALAVSDTCFLFGLFAQWLNFVEVHFYNREFVCQFFTFFSSLCSFCSVWFVVAFTVERFIAVMYPLKRQTMCTVKRAKVVLLGLTLVGCLHCTPFLFVSSPKYESKLNSTICDIRLEYKTSGFFSVRLLIFASNLMENTKDADGLQMVATVQLGMANTTNEFVAILNYVDTFVVFAVPFTTIVVLNTFTGCTVWKFATVRRTMTLQKRKTQVTRSPFSSSYRTRTVKQQSSLMSSCSHPNGQSCILHKESKRNSGRRKVTNSSQLKVTKMLLIVSTVFVCLNLPSYVMRLRTYLETESSKTTIVIQYITWILFITNFGINFVLYCVSGQNFRKAVISLFRNVSSQRDGNTQVTGRRLRMFETKDI